MVNMDRYIKRSDVYALFEQNGIARLHVADIDVIQDADVVPVVHGKWIDVREKRLFGDHYFLCSNCKSRNGSMISFNYCPNCGAKMDLEIKL